jgi:hypothetical protein
MSSQDSGMVYTIPSVDIPLTINGVDWDAVAKRKQPLAATDLQIVVYTLALRLSLISSLIELPTQWSVDETADARDAIIAIIGSIYATVTTLPKFGKALNREVNGGGYTSPNLTDATLSSNNALKITVSAMHPPEEPVKVAGIEA